MTNMLYSVILLLIYLMIGGKFMKSLIIETLFYMFQTIIYSMCLIYSVLQLFQEFSMVWLILGSVNLMLICSGICLKIRDFIEDAVHKEDNI